MKPKKSYKVIFEPQEEGGYTATVPALPGCVSEGETYDQALVNIQEAIESLQADGLPIPEETHLILEVEVAHESPASAHKP